MSKKELMTEQASIAERFERIVSAHGPWNAHNIKLGEDIYTRPASGHRPNPRLRQITQVVTDVVGSADLNGVRIADLGSLEGAFGIELAMRGAEVVAIEGRESNNARARFAAETLHLDRCTFVTGDVREFSMERFGSFDVVLCLGLLYHLEAASAFALLERVAAATRRALVLDTHVTDRGGDVYRANGHDYDGRLFGEHGASDSNERIEAREWASLDNLESYWPTRASLFDALIRSGFTSVLECHLPQSAIEDRDRVQLVAYAGEPADARTVPTPAEEVTPYVVRTRPRYDTLRGLRIATRVRRAVTRGRTRAQPAP